MSTVKIGIAIVERADEFLVGRRDVDAVLGGKAEFPGGKCEDGESPRDCAVRECREETELDVVASTLLLTHTHEYPHAVVELHFWHCRLVSEHANVPAGSFRWVSRRELAELDFPPANADLIQLLLKDETTPTSIAFQSSKSRTKGPGEESQDQM